MIKKQISARYAEAASWGLLRGPGGYTPINSPGPIGGAFFERFWDHPLHNLAQRPAVGSPDGAQPSTPNDRFMESFGSNDWPYPFLPTDQQINGPKGSLMNLNAPASLSGIGRLARIAVNQDTPAAADALLSEVRIVRSSRIERRLRRVVHFTDHSQVFAIFEYMNGRDFVTRFNAVRDQASTQLGYIEQDFATLAPEIVGRLQAWWPIFLDDYLLQIETWASNWAAQAIAYAFAPYNNARNSGRNLATYQQVRNTLNQWQSLIDGGSNPLRFPPYTGSQPQPRPSGGSGP